MRFVGWGVGVGALGLLTVIGGALSGLGTAGLAPGGLGAGSDGLASGLGARDGRGVSGDEKRLEGKLCASGMGDGSDVSSLSDPSPNSSSRFGLGLRLGGTGTLMAGFSCARVLFAVDLFLAARCGCMRRLVAMCVFLRGCAVHAGLAGAGVGVTAVLILMLVLVQVLMLIFWLFLLCCVARMPLSSPRWRGVSCHSGVGSRLRRVLSPLRQPCIYILVCVSLCHAF
jgi:hypothetical protein